MKIELLPTLALVGVACALLSVAPSETHGQATPVEEASPATLIAELTAQQALIEANQTKIEERLGTISEDIRQARIFVSRAGGTKKK